MILVIDDELPIREAVQDILELVDIETLTAPDGETGLKVFEQHKQSVRAIILDYQMPGLSGQETYALLRTIDEHVPIILSTGFDDSDFAAQIDKDSSLSLLHKPYAADALIESVQGALS